MGSIIVPLLHQVLALVKGMVYPTMNILPLFIHLYVVSNSMLWKWERILKKNLYAPLNNQIHLYWPYRHYTLYIIHYVLQNLRNIPKSLGFSFGQQAHKKQCFMLSNQQLVMQWW